MGGSFFKVLNTLGGTFSKGEEKGFFEFGASTIILIIKKDLVEIDEDIVYYSEMGIETIVKYGSKIGIRRQ